VSKRTTKSNSAPTTALSFRASAEFKQAAEKAAGDTGRSLSNWLRWLVTEEFKRLGGGDLKTRAPKGEHNHVA